MAIDSVSYPLNTLRMSAFPPSCAFKGFKHKVIPSGHRLSIDSLSKQGIVFEQYGIYLVQYNGLCRGTQWLGGNKEDLIGRVLYLSSRKI